ncbi:MAG: hypothetical protein DRP65_02735 [Planctomycetota bacterium]|nr:MAG: hypothetical protein DRP65_02735 [Planctomycetota bacterium]
MLPNVFHAKNIDNKNPPLYACWADSGPPRAISAVVFAVVIPVVVVAVLRALHTLQAAHTADMLPPCRYYEVYFIGCKIAKHTVITEWSRHIAIWPGKIYNQ